LAPTDDSERVLPEACFGASRLTDAKAIPLQTLQFRLSLK
jgi:hypothetical protein